ncbi:MAG TPA: DUF4236 domain-containing protein [Methylomirabilota bacterium]|nr:DUF4236 domain-containing protein [Methylomirabilota bacterium]
MGWFLRKSLRFGPLRLNLSKSGVGASVGIRGLRVGAGPRGSYIAGGRGGLYFREPLDPKRGRPPDVGGGTAHVVDQTHAVTSPAVPEVSLHGDRSHPDWAVLSVVASGAWMLVAFVASAAWLGLVATGAFGICGLFALRARASAITQTSYTMLLDRLSLTEDDSLLQELLTARRETHQSSDQLVRPHEHTYQRLVWLYVQTEPRQQAALDWLRRVGGFLGCPHDRRAALEREVWATWTTDVLRSTAGVNAALQQIGSARQQLGISDLSRDRAREAAVMSWSVAVTHTLSDRVPTGDEEQTLRRLRQTLLVPDGAAPEPDARLDQGSRIRIALRDGLPPVSVAIPLQPGELCYYHCPGSLHALRRGVDPQRLSESDREAVLGCLTVIHQGEVYVTSKGILVVANGAGSTRLVFQKLVGVQINAVVGGVTLTVDGRATPYVLALSEPLFGGWLVHELWRRTSSSPPTDSKDPRP